MLELCLDSQCDITKIDELYSNIHKALNEGENINLNVDKVEKVDTSALQLVLAALLYAKDLGLEFNLINPSECFVKSAKTIGIAEQLGFN